MQKRFEYVMTTEEYEEIVSKVASLKRRTKKMSKVSPKECITKERVSDWLEVIAQELEEIEYILTPDKSKQV